LTLEARRDVKIEDPGADLLDRATGIWDRYGRISMIALGVVAVGGAIVFLTMRARARSEAQAATQLAQANILYWQGEYAQSLEAARQVSQLFPSTPSGIDAHRLAGDDAYWTGDFKAAVTEYQAFLAQRKDGVLADAVRRSLAYAFESDGQLAEAAPTYEKLIGVFDRESSAEFMAAAARCYKALGQPDKALALLQRLVDEQGASSYAAIARVEIAEMKAATK